MWQVTRTRKYRCHSVTDLKDGQLSLNIHFLPSKVISKGRKLYTPFKNAEISFFKSHILFLFSSSKISRLKSKEIQPRISFPEQSQGDPGFSQTKVRRLKDFQDFSGAKSGGPRRSKMFFRAKSGGSRRSRIFSRAKSKVQGDSGFWDQVLNLTTYI